MRQIVVHAGDGPVHLTEVVADNEAQLQEQLMTHPELVPLEEFGLDGPMMVIGREAGLPSGAADLVGLARGGDIVVVEFKTGPQNSDFRHSLAQLLDYGAALWRIDPEAFETTIARRYFTGDHCPPGAPTRGTTSLAEAATRTWGLGDDELAAFGDRWRRSLDRGEFHYVLAAQRFTDPMQRTIDYLNDQSRTARFYAVELVRFTGDGLEAFEARSVITPQPVRSTSSGSIDEAQLLERIEDPDYREAVHELLEFARGQQLREEWGSAGVSLRIRVPEINEPLSIAWVWPPGVPGWLGLRDANLGHDAWRAERDIGDPSLLHRYLAALAAIPGAAQIENTSLKVFHLPPAVLVQHRSAVFDAIEALVHGVGELS